jgi:hypothetical protein
VRGDRPMKFDPGVWLCVAAFVAMIVGIAAFAHH